MDLHICIFFSGSLRQLLGSFKGNQRSEGQFIRPNKRGLELSTKTCKIKKILFSYDFLLIYIKDSFLFYYTDFYADSDPQILIINFNFQEILNHSTASSLSTAIIVINMLMIVLVAAHAILILKPKPKETGPPPVVTLSEIKAEKTTAPSHYSQLALRYFFLVYTYSLNSLIFLWVINKRFRILLLKKKNNFMLVAN